MSEAARVRESIDLVEFERRLRASPAEEPHTAYDYAPEAAAQVAARPAFPRAAGAAESAGTVPNPVNTLRQQLEAAASRSDSFHAVVDQYPHAAERFASAPPPAFEPEQFARQTEPVQEQAWRPEAFEPMDDAQSGLTRKRMMLLGSAAAVLVIGVGVTFTMRGGATNGEAPTIRASGEPFKIQPEPKATGEKPSQVATILDRNGSERLAASRVVTREEQPVDVREAVRQATAANPTAKPGPTAGAPTSALPTTGPAGNGYFPEPRRVRTVSVRPDGTIIEAPQAAPARVAPAPRAVAPVPAQTAAPAPVRVAAATPPKTSDRAGPTTTASTSPVATPAPAAPRAASPQSAAVASTPRGGGGAYAVQLAAPGSESEARSAIARFQQRYGSALGGRQPTVRKATVGAKDVYRVRVVGMSQTDANGLCEKLKSSGGNCFVARE
ncbi:MAG: SPOR domain-containing protein [Beijerinckiaceae bacterium]|nr:SPOR domain-containing protein [Beijerinckiaceae bacterium]